MAKSGEACEGCVNGEELRSKVEDDSWRGRVYNVLHGHAGKASHNWAGPKQILTRGLTTISFFQDGKLSKLYDYIISN